MEGTEVGHVHIREFEDGKIQFDFHWTGKQTEERIIGEFFRRLDEERKRGMES